MVLLAVITEFQLAERKHDVLSNSIGAAGLGIPNSPNVPRIENVLAKIAHVAVILGTVVWGYGDIIR